VRSRRIVAIVCIASFSLAVFATEVAAKSEPVIKTGTLGSPVKVGPYVLTVNHVTQNGSGDGRSVASMTFSIANVSGRSVRMPGASTACQGAATWAGASLRSDGSRPDWLGAHRSLENVQYDFSPGAPLCATPEIRFGVEVPRGTGQFTQVRIPVGDEAASSAHVADGWITYWDESHGMSIAVPPTWQAAQSTLTPALVDPTVRLAVGTYVLEPERHEDCDIVPERALDALGPTDAFIAVYLTRGGASFGSTTPRPAHFTPDMFRSGFQCSENVNGTTGSFHFLDHGKKISVIVAIGTDASAERRAEVYEILDSLSVTPTL
jgi:hypothetical protein